MYIYIQYTHIHIYTIHYTHIHIYTYARLLGSRLKPACLFHEVLLKTCNPIGAQFVRLKLGLASVAIQFQQAGDAWMSPVLGSQPRANVLCLRSDSLSGEPIQGPAHGCWKFGWVCTSHANDRVAL